MRVSKSIGLCAHFTYNLPKYFSDWIDLHLNFGVEEIMLYDGTPNQMLTKMIDQKYPKDNRISVNPYKINKKTLCNDSSFSKTKYSNIKELLKKLCLRFYDSEFRQFYTLRSSHEQITANDCLTQMNKKHEFIARFDLDEFVFPRAYHMNWSSQQYFKGICSQKPFQLKRINDKQTSSYYNYLQWDKGNVEPKRSNIELKKIIVELKKINSKSA